MHPSVKTLSAACASALLVACADMGHLGKSASVPGRPAISADEAYVVARQKHLAYRLPAAIDNYQAALRADPHHVNATNGLATLYAEQGNLPKAIGMWRELSIDAVDSPATAFIHSNLGYAYLLNGDFQLAIASLERACVLDPFNHRAWRHLGNALAKVGQDERAQRMLRQADSLEHHDLHRDYALTSAAPLPAVTDIDTALAAASKAAPAAAPQQQPGKGVAVELAGAAAPAAGVRLDDFPATELRQTGSAMFELHRPVRAPAPAAAVKPLPPPLARKPEEEVIEAPARVEIRNGNGVTGMARSLSGAIDNAQLRVVRLSNEKGFAVERTRVEYQPGFADAAARLAERFNGEAVAAVAGGNVDMRLIFGSDLARSKADARRVIRAALGRAAKLQAG